MFAFRNAISSAEISIDVNNLSLRGRLLNNLGCVNAETGNYEGALNDFEQSLRYQKNNASSRDADTADAENLLSISLTIFNIGVTCAKRKHYSTALKHTEASYAMQEALVGVNSDLANNTLFYLSLLKKVTTSEQSPDRNTSKKTHIRDAPVSSPSRTKNRKGEVSDIVSDIRPLLA